METKLASVGVTIEGKTPLMLNRFTEDAQAKATTGANTVLVGDKGSPREQAARKLYVGVDGSTLIIPQPNLFRCLIDAGKYMKAGKSKLSTQKSSLIPACLEIEGAEIPIEHTEQWETDSRPVRIPSTGGRILCYRPMFHDWRLTFVLNVDTSMLTIKVAYELVHIAGQRIGLGDFRPDCKGPYGKFRIVRWEELAQEQAA